MAAEAAKLDALFVADHVGMWDTYKSNIIHYANPRLEPITLLSALSAVTSKLGLLATVSASYTEPYNLARMFASLDHLSYGRAGWNVVTSSMPEEAMNFGLDGNLDHANRYERADEYLHLVKALWDSVEHEALLLNRETGFFADPQRIYRINHVGKYFHVRGPLNVLGRHRVIRSLSRPAHRMTARRSRRSMPTSTLPSCARLMKASATARISMHASSPRARATRLEDPAGIHPIVGTSRDEAKEKEDFLQTLVPERIGVDLVSSWSGVDVSDQPIDGPLPPLPDIDTYDGQRSNLERIKAFADQGLSIREIAHHLINAGTVPSIIGTPVDVATSWKAWFEGGAADGFNLMFPLLPEDWLQFTTLVVPELQRRELAETQDPWRHPARSLELEETKQSLPSKLTISTGKGPLRKGRVVSCLRRHFEDDPLFNPHILRCPRNLCMINV